MAIFYMQVNWEGKELMWVCFQHVKMLSDEGDTDDSASLPLSSSITPLCTSVSSPEPSTPRRRSTRLNPALQSPTAEETGIETSGPSTRNHRSSKENLQRPSKVGSRRSPRLHPSSTRIIPVSLPKAAELPSPSTSYNRALRSVRASDASAGSYRQSQRRIFECKVCAKQLTSKEKLSHHMNVHTGNKPYGCNLCSKTFASSANIYRHRQTNFPPTFECKYCHKKLSRPSHLRAHQYGNKLRGVGCKVRRRQLLAKKNRKR